jgi:hypothetical protein
MSENNIPQKGLRKEISQLGFGAIALNGTIGAGIFALPAIAIELAGLFSPWIYVLCGLLIMLIVFVFARAASYFSDTGGPVTYAGRAFGPFAGFQAGWLLTLSRAAAFAANAHLMITYAGWLWPPLLDGAWHTAAVLAICVLLAIINAIGIRQSMMAIFALTVLKLLPLTLLVLLGIGQFDPGIFTDADVPPLNSLGETMLVVLYAFVGFESAVIPAGEARDGVRGAGSGRQQDSTGRCRPGADGHGRRGPADAGRRVLDRRKPDREHAVGAANGIRDGSYRQHATLVRRRPFAVPHSGQCNRLLRRVLDRAGAQRRICLAGRDEHRGSPAGVRDVHCDPAAPASPDR